jgi:hypothetical protein
VIQETLNNKTKIHYFFSQRLKPNLYIIQKSINLISKNTSIIDFRIYLTKDSAKKWKCITIFSKQGMPGEIVSNVNRGGKAGMGLQILKDTLHLSDQEIKEIEKSINTVAINAAKAIENSGVHFANTAIDIGIDNNKRVWIIEIQHSAPGQKGFLQDKTLYYEYLTTIMLYAKTLAGF